MPGRKQKEQAHNGVTRLRRRPWEDVGLREEPGVSSNPRVLTVRTVCSIVPQTFVSE